MGPAAGFTSIPECCWVSRLAPPGPHASFPINRTPTWVAAHQVISIDSEGPWYTGGRFQETCTRGSRCFPVRQHHLAAGSRNNPTVSTELQHLSHFSSACRTARHYLLFLLSRTVHSFISFLPCLLFLRCQLIKAQKMAISKIQSLRYSFLLPLLSS